jgi:hypothetical protein
MERGNRPWLETVPGAAFLEPSSQDQNLVGKGCIAIADSFEQNAPKGSGDGVVRVLKSSLN